MSGASRDRGGTGEAWVAGELLMTALASCAMSIVADVAEKGGIALHDITISATSERDPNDPTRYAFVKLDFAMKGPDQAQAEHLVKEFQANCPIYGTVSRGAPLEVSIQTTP